VASIRLFVDILFKTSSPFGLDVRSTAEKDSSGVVVGGGERQHDGTSAGGVDTDSIRNIIQRSFFVGVIVQKRSGPVGLDEELSRGKEPGQREQVGGEGSREQVEVDGAFASRWEELIGGVILTRVIDVATVSATSDLTESGEYVSICRRYWLQGLRLTMIMEPSSNVSLWV
jgi:hypothetical protein